MIIHSLGNKKEKIVRLVKYYQNSNKGVEEKQNTKTFNRITQHTRLRRTKENTQLLGQLVDHDLQLRKWMN